MWNASGLATMRSKPRVNATPGQIQGGVEITSLVRTDSQAKSGSFLHTSYRTAAAPRKPIPEHIVCSAESKIG